MKLSEKKLNVKSILLITVILPVIVIIVSSVAIYFTAKSVQPGSVFDPAALTASEYEAPSSGKEALEEFTQYITKGINSGILKYSGKTSADTGAIECKNEEIGKILSYMSGSFASHFEGFYEENAISYGEDAAFIETLLPGSTPDSFEAAENENIITLTLTYKKVFDNMYFYGSDKKAVSMFIEENKNVFSCTAESLVPGDVVYTLQINEKTSEIMSLEIKRSYSFSFVATFTNTLSSIGSTSVSMTPAFSEKYDFSFAGISIEEDIKTLDKNGYDTLTVIPRTEENLAEDEYSLSFSSSDENIATVDENGQVTAVNESESPAVITVTLSYLGKTFTDSCEVYVVTPVEKVTLSATELSLEKGEKASLTAEVSPEDATIKTVLFHSSDEKVAKVSENGEITAVSEGTATITAYSAHGFISAECSVTVTE